MPGPSPTRTGSRGRPHQPETGGLAAIAAHPGLSHTWLTRLDDGTFTDAWRWDTTGQMHAARTTKNGSPAAMPVRCPQQPPTTKGKSC